MSPNKLPYTGFINEGVEKVLEFEPLFLGTEERSIVVDETKIAGMAEYRKIGRLLGDLPGNERINFELTEPEDDDKRRYPNCKLCSFSEGSARLGLRFWIMQRTYSCTVCTCSQSNISNIGRYNIQVLCTWERNTHRWLARLHTITAVRMCSRKGYS